MHSSQVGLWFFLCPDTRMCICAYSASFCSHPLAFSMPTVHLFEVDHSGAVLPRCLSKLSHHYRSSRTTTLVHVALKKIWLVLPCLMLVYGFAPPASRRTMPMTWFVACVAKIGLPLAHPSMAIAWLLSTRIIPPPLWCINQPFRMPSVLQHWPVALGP